MKDLSECTVLIVEDTVSNLNILVDALADDYQVSVALDGVSALEDVAEHPPDLILLDILMPGMDGYEVCERLKRSEATRDIPIIFLSALDKVWSKTRAFNLGAVDYVTKPFEILEVKARVRTHLELQAARRELAHKDRLIRRILGRYVSDDVVDRVVDTPEGLQLGGEKRTVTIAASDLRGFTPISEPLPGDQAVELINIYLEPMTEIILRHQGTICDFMGDAVLAVFGAPFSGPDDADRAVRCAVAMQLAMSEVHRSGRAKGYPVPEQGIGIHTGQVVWGSFGSGRRMKYDVIGSAVNVAFRLGSCTVGGQILISQATYDACQEPLQVNEHIELPVMGLRDLVSVYDIGGVEGQKLPAKEQELTALPDPLAVRLTVLEGKLATQTEVVGHIVKLADRGAEIRADRALQRFTDLRIELQDPQGGTVTSNLYAKVVRDGHESAEPKSIAVVFTSTTEEQRAFLREHLASCR